MNNMLKSKIINDLLQEQSINTVCMMYGISKQELNNILKDTRMNLYNVRKELLYKGDLFFTEDDSSLYYTLHGLDNLKEVRMVVMADYHLGNIASKEEYAYVMGNYMKKENINVGLVLGDLLDGNYTTIMSRNMNLDEQINNLCSTFPMDPFINYYVLLGNHDRHSLKYKNYDIAPILFRKRIDMAIMGYGYQALKIQNDYIHLQHKLCDSSCKNTFPLTNINTIMLLGHSHTLKVVPQKFFKVYVLPMCDLYHADYAYYPGFLDMVFEMNNTGRFNKVFSKEVIIVDNKPFINNEFMIDLVKKTTDYDEEKRILKRKM